MCLSMYLYIYVTLNISVCMSVCLCLSVCLYVYLSIYLSIPVYKMVTLDVSTLYDISVQSNDINNSLGEVVENSFLSKRVAEMLLFTMPEIQYMFKWLIG